MTKIYFGINNITWLPGTLFTIVVVSNLIASSFFKTTEPSSILMNTLTATYLVIAISALLLGIFQIHSKKMLSGIMNTILGIAFFYQFLFGLLFSLIGYFFVWGS